MNSLARNNPLTGEGASFSEIIARSFYTAGLESPSDIPIVAAAGDALINQASLVVSYLEELQGMIDALDGEARISAQSEFNALRRLALEGKMDVGAIRAMIQERADFSNLQRLEALRQEAEREAERERRRVRDQEWEDAVNDTRAMIDRAEREGRITAEEAENLRNGLQAIDAGQREIHRLDDAIKDAPPGTDTSELEAQRDAAMAERDRIRNAMSGLPGADRIAANENDAATIATVISPPTTSAPTNTVVADASASPQPASAVSAEDALFASLLAGATDTPPEPEPAVLEASLETVSSPTVTTAKPQTTVAPRATVTA